MESQCRKLKFKYVTHKLYSGLGVFVVVESDSEKLDKYWPDVATFHTFYKGIH